MDSDALGMPQRPIPPADHLDGAPSQNEFVCRFVGDPSVLAAAAMPLSSVSVVGNALRLRATKVE